MRLNVSCNVTAHHFSKFQRILQLDGKSAQDLVESLDVLKNSSKVFKAGQGAGASGSFFFFSKDNRFLIKSTSKSEMKKLFYILDDYIKHMEAT